MSLLLRTDVTFLRDFYLIFYWYVTQFVDSYFSHMSVSYSQYLTVTSEISLKFMVLYRQVLYPGLIIELSVRFLIHPYFHLEWSTDCNL